MKLKNATKATCPRLWRITRTTSIVVALALLIALVAGVASLGVAKPTGTQPTSPLLMAATNTANGITTLINSKAGEAALNLQVSSANSTDPKPAPLAVNSDTVVTNLNADKVDGKDASQLSGLGSVYRSPEVQVEADSAPQADLYCVNPTDVIIAPLYRLDNESDHMTKSDISLPGPLSPGVEQPSMRFEWRDSTGSTNTGGASLHLYCAKATG